MAINKLKSTHVKAAAPGAKLFDGGGLWLKVNSTGSRRWSYRYTASGKAHEVGLGGHHLSLGQARDLRDAMQQAIREGQNPAAERQAAAVVTSGGLSPASPFADLLQAVIDMKAPIWKSKKTPDQWRNTLSQHAPALMLTPIEQVTTEVVLEALQPIWTDIPVTAQRVQQRIAVAMGYAKSRKLYLNDNPAEWRNHLENLLPAISSFHEEQHLPAMPYQDVPDFFAAALEAEAGSVDCLLFCILTAVRSGEARGALWAEISDETWTVPGARMKGGKSHRVPISSQAQQILAKRKIIAPLISQRVIFPNNKGNPLTDVALNKSLKRYGGGDFSVHGFRTSIRMWMADNGVDDIVGEQVLAHIEKDKVKAAYQRSDRLELRREIMQRWGDFCLNL